MGSRDDNMSTNMKTQSPAPPTLGGMPQEETSNAKVMQALTSFRQSVEQRIDNMHKDFHNELEVNTQKTMDSTILEVGALTAKLSD